MATALKEFKNTAPIKVVQFGGGVFMRGFIDWMLQEMNDRGHYHGAAAVIKLTPGGSMDVYEQQQGVFQHVIRGVEQGTVVNRTQRVSSIGQWIHPYKAWDDFLQLAENPDLEAVFSNSTEAGIAYASCALPLSCPDSFPAKLCAFLHRRFTASLPGLWIFPCELIEANADTLRDIVLRHADDWNLDDDFMTWLRTENTWVNTLVDRIVAAPPAAEVAALADESGIVDGLLNSSEPYHIFVLDCDPSCESILPFQKSGLNIVYTDDLAAYRERKVKLLNGAHTSMLFLSYMRGNNTVEDSLNDPAIESFLRNCLYTDVIPTIDMPPQELKAYADSILERFRNPFLKHKLLSISLNSISKVQFRILATIEDFHTRFQKLPQHLMLGLAAFLRFYRVEKKDDVYLGHRGDDIYQLGDSSDQIDRILEMWASIDAGENPQAAVAKLFAQVDLWGFDLTRLPQFSEQLASRMEELAATPLEQIEIS